MSISTKMRASIENSSLIRKMFEEGRRLKEIHGDDKVYDFSLGNPDIPPPVEFTESLIKNAAVRNPDYHALPPERGLLATRVSISKMISSEQGVTIQPDDMIMTYGASGALNITFKALLNQGDEVIVPKPYFVDYTSYIGNHGGISIFVNTDSDFNLDIQAISNAVTPKTKAVIINSPNNPTGQVYSAESLRALGELLEEKSTQLGTSIFLIMDEPYRKIVFDGLEVPSILNWYKNSIVASSFSKDLSIPGERVGYLAVHPEIEDKAELLQAMQYANQILGYKSAPTLMQHVIADLSDPVLEVSIYAKRRELFCDILSDAGYSFLKPKGTFYIFPEAPGADDKQFCEHLKDERILAVPGIGFGTPGYFRLAFCVPDSVIVNSAQGFRNAIAKFKQ